MISITNSSVTISDNVYSLQNIYDYAINNNYKQVQKLGNNYLITNNLIIKSGAIEDINISLTVEGELLQIHKNAHLKLGKVRGDLSTHSGCRLSAPNIKTAYGFGCTDKSDSGNLFLYGCIVDIWGFWGFFNSDNTHVEIIDCQVNGFGRIEGSQSILKNINFKASHGQYGILSPKGQLKINENLSVFDSVQVKSNRCAIYYNPQYANNLTITGGIYAGYDDLAYIESTSGGDQLRFIDSDIRDGYSLNRESNNADMFHDFTFAPTIRDCDGNPISSARVVINDNTGTEVFSGLSDPDGNTSTILNYYTQDRNGVESYKTPHTITVSKDKITSTYILNIDKPRKNFPIFLVESTSSTSSTGTGCSCDDQLKQLNDMEDRLNTKLNLMESGIRQVISNVADEVNENETYFKESGFTIML